MRSGLSSPLMRNVTLACILKFTVLLWNDWTGGELSLIGRQRSQTHRIGKGGAQCRLLCDFPVKSGSWIYFIKFGDMFAAVFRKIMLCSGFRWLLFLKMQFWGRHVCHCDPATKSPQVEMSDCWHATFQRRQYCSKITSLAFTDTCSDSTFAEYHLLCLSLMTALP